MKNKLIAFWMLGLLLAPSLSRADEGMWIPILLEKYNMAQMQKLGFKLTADDIYSVNHASMKDAVVIFGGGCTGEMISDEGLLITNHHCGFGNIQSHSTLDHDYLTDGFWAMSREEELTNAGLTVTFLVRMEDVSDRINAVLNDNMPEAERQQIIDLLSKEIQDEAIAGTHYQAMVKPFYNGNQFFLFVNEVFRDVRLVGAPPSAIGKFGGDTDNWMWPRHTGDFSLFRVYCAPDGTPAEYSPDNVPYKPKQHFPISLKGVKEGDFTMVFGFPGRTQEYLPSYAVETITKVQNPSRIQMRQARIDIMTSAMTVDRGVRIQYASKHAGASNAWKKWIGENKGLERLDAIAVKQKQEEEFMFWVNSNPQLSSQYSHIIPEYERIYTELKPYKLAADNLLEGPWRIEVVSAASRFRAVTMLGEKPDPNLLKEELDKLRTYGKGFFKDYSMAIDKETATQLLSIYRKNLGTSFELQAYSIIDKKYKGDIEAYVNNYLFAKSFMYNEAAFMDFLDNYSYKKLLADPAYQLMSNIIDIYINQLSPSTQKLETELEVLDRLYMRALMEMDTTRILYPDANSTLRVSYGQVSGYDPYDGVSYKYYTTLEGIIEKDNPEIYDYDVPDGLLALYKSKDYGRYGVNGTMPVCFTASNHTTGGNSGSPVIDANGYLIGINFDRCWEGTMSDIMYDPAKCRNITLDIRYALFLIEKLAGATHLIDEMTLIE